MRTSPIRFGPYILLLLVLSLFALSPLLAPGYFYGAHDGRHSVFFVSMFDESFRSGALWPRWAMHHNQGYGYPTFLLQAPLAFYLAEVFVLLGAGITTAVKIVWSVGFLAGAWGMYSLVKSWLIGDSVHTLEGERSESTTTAMGAISLSAVVAGLLYTYAPYHLLNIYVRAAFAETLLLAWFPWVFLAFDRLIARGFSDGWQGRLLVAALSYAGLMLTHSLSLFSFTPLLIAFVLFRLWTVWRRACVAESMESGGAGDASDKAQGSRTACLVRSTLLAASAGIAAVLLVAVFLVPLFLESSYIVQDEWTRNTYNYTRHWVHWGQFLSPFWGYGYSDDPVGANDGMGFQLGLMLSLLTIAATFLLLLPAIGRIRIRRKRGATQSPAESKTSRLYPWILFLLLATIATLVLMTPAAEGLWDRVSLLAVIQFPWRLLGLAILSTSALGGLTVWLLASEGVGLRQPYHAEGALLVVALLVCFASVAYAQPEELQPVEPWREDGRAVRQFEREHPDMVASTRFVEEPVTDSPLSEQYLADDYSAEKLTRFRILSGEGEVVHQSGMGQAYSGIVDMTSEGIVQVLLYYFPGWQITVDGQTVPHRVSSPNGLIEVDVPEGRHEIEVRMGSTPPRTIGAAISTTTLLVLIGLWLYSRRSRRSSPSR